MSQLSPSIESALALLQVNIAGAIRSAVDNPSKAELIISNIENFPGMDLLRQALIDKAPIGRAATKRVILHRNGDPIHFDVTCDFQGLAERLGWKAEKASSRVTTVAEGNVIVENVR